MRYKLLALDIDGTLLDPYGEIRPRVRQAVRAAVEAGCLVTLATGRRQRAARVVANELGLQIPLILYTGSLVYDTLTESALFHHPMPTAFLQQAIKLIREAGLRPAVLQSPLRGEYIYLGPAEDDDDYTRGYAQDKIRFDLIQRCPYAELATIEDALTVSVAGPGATALTLAAALPQQMACSVFGYPLHHKTLPDLHGFDIVQPDVSKGKALHWLARHFGIAPEETMAVGDSLNDLEMLKAAGLGVAMGNAQPEVQAVADAIVGTNRDDGVAEAIERFILSK